MKCEMLAVGRIKKSHGIQGYIKMVPYNSTHNEYLLDLEKVLLRKDENESSFILEDIRPMGSLFLLKFEGIDTPEELRPYSGWEVYTERNNAAPLEEGEFYFADLCGCRLFCEETEEGVVESVVEGGGGTLLEVKCSTGNVFVPFNDHFIGRVDIDSGRVELKHRWILE